MRTNIMKEKLVTVLFSRWFLSHFAKYHNREIVGESEENFASKGFRSLRSDGRRYPERKLETASFTFIFALFFIKGLVFLDPDFGWRVRAGEIFIKEGIPKHDLFTYSMPTFPWVEHSYSLSALMWLIFSMFGMVGLSFFFTAAVLITLFIVSSEKKIRKLTNILYYKALGLKLGVFSSFPFLLSISLIFVFFGVRAQVVTWLMFALFLKFILDEKLWPRFRIFVPLYFIVWANVHGGFASGLISFFLFVIARIFREKKFDFFNLSLALISTVATLINPYGIGIWREVWSSISDSNLRFAINEWMPALTMLNLPMVLYMTFSSVFIWKERKSFKIEELVLFLFFLIQSLGSRRHLPLWVIVAFPLTTKAIWAFYKRISKEKSARERFFIAYKWAWVGVVGVIFFQLFFDYAEGITLNEKNYYPLNGVAYLKENLPKGEIFSEYGWGGYLIWKLPEKKVFIDGRMPSWKQSSQSDNETKSAFEDYNKILKGEKNYKEIFSKYNIDTVFWSKPKKETKLSEYFNQAEDFLTKFGWKKKDFKLLKELENDGWQKIFEDNVAEIYKI